MEHYYARCGLLHDPFARNSSKGFVFESSEYREAVKRLEFLRSLCGIGILCGPAGSGKTTIVRSWADSLPSSKYKVCYLNISTLTVSEFYRQLAVLLNLEPAFRKSDNFRAIQAEIVRLHDEKRIVPVIIIDEAQYMTSSVLQDLKMLFNFEMDSKEKAIVLLCGLGQLKLILRQTNHEPLRQRIVINITIEPLSQEECGQYILKRIESADGPEDLFSDSALHLVTAASRGCLRMADRISSRCLIIADVMKKERIDNDVAAAAIADVEV